MVLQRSIDNLRERPHHERRAVALGCSIAVMAVLLVAWGVYFFRDAAPAGIKQVQKTYDQAVEAVPAPRDTTGWVSQGAPETQMQAPPEAQSPDAQTVVQTYGDMQLIQEGTTTASTSTSY